MTWPRQFVPAPVRSHFGLGPPPFRVPRDGSESEDGACRQAPQIHQGNGRILH